MHYFALKTYVYHDGFEIKRFLKVYCHHLLKREQSGYCPLPLTILKNEWISVSLSFTSAMEDTNKNTFILRVIPLQMYRKRDGEKW